MSATGVRSPVEKRDALAYGTVVLLAILYSWHRAHVYVAGLPPFWDAHVYARALTAWGHGQDPYLAGENSPLPFVSPPIFLYLMACFSRLLQAQAGASCYLGAACAATLMSPALLARYYLRSRWLTAPLCLLISWFQPGHYGSESLLSGNLSNLLYASVLVAGVPGLKRNQWLPFYLALIFASTMKLPFLAFLLLPLCAGERQEVRSCTAALAVLAGYLAQRFFLPQYWQEFQANVIYRVSVQGDSGFGLLGQFHRHRDHLGVFGRLTPATDAVLVLLPLVLSLIVLRKRRLAVRQLWIPCLVVVSILSNPRTLAYDAALGVIPALYIVVECVRSLRVSSPWLPQLLLASALLATFLVARGELTVCLLLLLAPVLVIFRLLWSEPHLST